MKFAKSILRNQVPEWSQHYVDYKGLKKLIKQAVAGAESGAAGSDAREEAIALFFFTLDRNAELVDSFYNSKYSEYARRLHHIMERFPLAFTGARTVDADELEDLIGVFLELRSKLRKLQWYAEVNKRAFSKILKKFDKKVGTRTQTRYFDSKIQILPFANGSRIAEQIGITNQYLDVIAPDAPLNNTEDLFHGLTLHHQNKSANSVDVMDESAAFKLAIDADEDQSLIPLYERQTPSHKANISLLLRALAAQSNKCIPVLLKHCDLLEDPSEINNRNVLHRLVIHKGRKANDADLYSHIAASTLMRSGSPPKVVKTDIQSDGTEQSLEFLIENLAPSQRSVLNAPDQQLRTPLHYSAKYGQPEICRLLLRYAAEWEFLHGRSGLLGLGWKDSEGQTPIDLAVENNKPQTTRVLLKYGVPDSEQNRQLLNPLIIRAVRIDSVEVLSVLLEFGCDINYQDPRTGETALYVAAKHAFTRSSQYLLEQGASLGIAEKTFGWTPLFVAAVDGSMEIAEMLIAAGASLDAVDSSGWTPKEHAALRGHIELSQLFPPGPMPESVSGIDANGPRKVPSPDEIGKGSINHRRPIHSEDGVEFIKTFGHSYLRDPSKTLVLVTLGSKDIRHNGSPVELEEVPLSQAGKTELDTALSLAVSASNCSGEGPVVDLPVPEFGLSTEPILFYTEDPSKVQLTFDLVPTYSTSRKVLGRAVALLDNVIKKVGDTRSNLNDTLTLPILEASTLRVLGTVTFGFLLVTPFVHPESGVGKSSSYWKSLITTRVIGHRGLGKNTLSTSSLQLGENTVESFIQAANLGASYVEFDVQLTKDYVPVIYHDFLVSDSGFDIPMHNLTLMQFMDIHNPKKRRHSGSKARDHVPRRSMSMIDPGDGNDGSFYNDVTEHMRLTRDFQQRGLKGNVRGHSIQSKFATLEELFKTLPQSVGFNVECKYPMIDECEAEDMESVVIEINDWVDTVLKCVFDNKGDRDVIFSSFNPDVCCVLALKQPSIPVLFLTESGTAKMMDVRASSLQEAIRFSRCWNLLGLVSESTPIVDCPRLADVVKNSGLVCFTYGTLNNDPRNVERQLKAGVDAVIVDSVMQVRTQLTEEVARGPAPQDPAEVIYFVNENTSCAEEEIDPKDVGAAPATAS